MPNGDDSDQENRDNRHSNSALSNNSSGLNCFRSWSIVNEIGNGACLLRCIARHVFNNPLFHFSVRHQRLSHMSRHMHDIIPGSARNNFLQAIITGINEEYNQDFWLPSKHTTIALIITVSSWQIRPRTLLIIHKLWPQSNCTISNYD